MKSKIIFGSLVLFVAACSTNSQMPTHRWASTEDANRVKYQQDHARCQSETGLTTGRNELDPDSASFKAYKQCMISSGYVLTAYTE
jgi:hypothetical protein